MFSRSGKLVQIEYALAAVAAGAPSVGIEAANGAVLATEKRQKATPCDERGGQHAGWRTGPWAQIAERLCTALRAQQGPRSPGALPTARWAREELLCCKNGLIWGRSSTRSVFANLWLDEGRPRSFRSDPSGVAVSGQPAAGKNHGNRDFPGKDVTRVWDLTTPFIPPC